MCYNVGMEKFNFKHQCHDDVVRVIDVARNNGYDIDYFTASEIWGTHSDDYAASWLGLPDTDKELFGIIEKIIVDKRERIDYNK